MHRQSTGELACVEAEAATLHSHPSGPDPLAEMRDRSRPEGNVDVRVEVEQPLPLRLRVTPADRNHLLGIARFQGVRLGEMRREALVGLLADRARVEDDHVSLFLSRRLAQPELLEHPLDPLGVVSVHLAAEGRDVVPAHEPKL